MKALDTTIEAEKIQIEIFRKMKAEQRLKMAISLTQTDRKLLMAGVRKRHPEYNENQIRLAVIRLTLGANLFSTVYPETKDILP